MFAVGSGGKEELGETLKNTRTQTLAADKVVVVIYSLFVLSYKVPNVSVTTGIYIFLHFWKGDGISFDIRIS